MLVLLVVTQIVAIAIVFVSGLSASNWPTWSLAGLALGSGWLGITNAALMRMAGPRA